MRKPSFGDRLAWSFAAMAAIVAIIAIGLAIGPAGPSRERKTVWDAHHAVRLQTPLSRYTYDRARVVRGTIADSAGKPLPGVSVRCLNARALEDLIKAGPQALGLWGRPDRVEAQTVTDSEGGFEFPHLPEGARTFCFSKPGYAPAVRNLATVQDGLGARLDATLGDPKSLRVCWSGASAEVRRLTLVPYRWWPEPRVLDVEPGAVSATFPDLGGPFRKVAILDPRVGGDGASPPRVLKFVDLDQTQEVDLGDLGSPPDADRGSTIEEAEGLETWAKAPTDAHRVFYGILNPWAMFWRELPSSAPVKGSASTASAPEKPAATTPKPPASGAGVIRGFGIGAFCPVLLESTSGEGRVGWTSTASEFEFVGLPAGDYRVRALGPFGVLGFVRGLRLRSGGDVKLETGFEETVKRSEETSREAVGAVYWENGLPAADSEVIMQNTADFRYYLERARTDANGFFRFSKVAANASYFLFALPPGESAIAMKRFTNFTADPARREFWFNLELSPHRIVGQVPAGSRASSLRLLQVQEGRPDQFLWETQADPLGRFEISNVPHGRYRAVATDSQNGAAASSLPFDVQDGRLVIELQWPSGTGLNAGASLPRPAR